VNLGHPCRRCKGSTRVVDVEQRADGHLKRRRECTAGCTFAAGDLDGEAGRPFRYTTWEIDTGRLDLVSDPDGGKEPADQSFPPVGSQER
jgi:hypothetical protein